MFLCLVILPHSPKWSAPQRGAESPVPSSAKSRLSHRQKFHPPNPDLQRPLVLVNDTAEQVDGQPSIRSLLNTGNREAVGFKQGDGANHIRGNDQIMVLMLLRK